MQPLNLRAITLGEFLLRRRALRRQLVARTDLTDLRIAVLGGSTTNELVDLLEILLLDGGFRPVFYQSEYGRYYEDAVLEPETIAAFKPDIVYIHTCVVNIQGLPPVSCNEAEFSLFVQAEMNRYRAIWTSLSDTVNCQIIQNNFELPAIAILGNFDAVSPGGASRFVNELNREFALEVAANPRARSARLRAIECLAVAA